MEQKNEFCPKREALHVCWMKDEMHTKMGGTVRRGMCIKYEFIICAKKRGSATLTGF